MTDTISPPAPRFLGRRVERQEDPRFLLGHGRYVADIALPGMVHAALVRSPHAHARIVRMDTRRAMAVSGVVAVYTGGDIDARLARPMTSPGRPPDRKPVPSSPLAMGTVRFVGDPLAVVVAVDRYVAEDAAELVDVEYELLPAILDVEEALAPGAPLVDERLGDNCIGRFAGEVGDVARAFASAHAVVRAVFRQNRQSHMPLETRGCIARWDTAAGALELTTSTQIPHIARDALADLLGVPLHRLRVIAPDVGGGFGQKGSLAREDVVMSVASRLTGRPVKWIEDRRENLIAAHHAREDTCHVEVAVQKDGVILGLRARMLADTGAYPPYPFHAASFTYFGTRGIVGPWRIDAFAYEGHALATNKCPQCPYRAPALIGNVVGEGMMELIAQELGLDPLEVRQKNIIRAADQPFFSAIGFPVDDVTVADTLQRAAAELGYEAFRDEQRRARAGGRYLGLGLATFIEPGAPGSYMYIPSRMPYVRGWDSALVRVEPSGHVRVMVGISPHGQGNATTMAQLVADELGIDIDDIAVQHGDTDRDPYGAGTQASRSAVIGGGAVIKASRAVRAKMMRIAAYMLEAGVDALELRGHGRIGVQGAPERETTIAAVAEMAYRNTVHLPEDEEPGLEALARHDNGPFSVSNATHACVVEVDIDTGRVTIVRYLVVEDCGTPINPMIVDGQIHGGVVQGIGGVLHEHAIYDAEGQPLAGTLTEYRVPTAVDAPRVEVVHAGVPAPGTFHGIKPMAEGGVMGAAPAVMNAVADALAPLGVRVTELPLTPPRIRALIRGARNEDR